MAPLCIPHCIFAGDVTPTPEAPLKCPLFHWPGPRSSPAAPLPQPGLNLRQRLNLSHKTWGGTLALRKPHQKLAAGREGEWTKTLEVQSRCDSPVHPKSAETMATWTPLPEYNSAWLDQLSHLSPRLAFLPATRPALSGSDTTQLRQFSTGGNAFSSPDWREGGGGGGRQRRRGARRPAPTKSLRDAGGHQGSEGASPRDGGSRPEREHGQEEGSKEVQTAGGGVRSGGLAS